MAQRKEPGKDVTGPVWVKSEESPTWVSEFSSLASLLGEKLLDVEAAGLRTTFSAGRQPSPQATSFPGDGNETRRRVPEVNMPAH